MDPQNIQVPYTKAWYLRSSRVHQDSRTQDPIRDPYWVQFYILYISQVQVGSPSITTGPGSV